jgi:porphobilinogen deaminase
MVFMLPMKFLPPSNDKEEVVLTDQVAQLALDHMMVVFEKPTDDESQHLKALFVKGRIDGQRVSKILIDEGAAINIMPYVMYQRLGKGDQDFTKTDMMLKDFEGNVSPAKGAVCIELTIGSKTMMTMFFVINDKGVYNLLLGRDWIHANCCVPSTMHQCLIQWVGDKIEVVPGDSSYIIASTESDTYE